MDSGNAVSESNENNNSYSLSFTVGAATSASSPVPVYRFYSPSAATHFYTGNAGEANGLRNGSPAGWNYEGVAYYAYPAGSPGPGTVPLYRFYSPVYRGHFYTRNEAEKNSLIANSKATWRYEGIAFYVAPSQVSGTVPVYRFWNPVAKHHFYTRNANEAYNLRYKITSKNYNWEGIAFYAWETVSSTASAANAVDIVRSGIAKSAAAPGPKSEAAQDTEAMAAAITLESASGTVLAGTLTEVGGVALEASSDAPSSADLASDAIETDSVVSLRLVAPSETAVSFWNSSRGAEETEIDEDGEFSLRADGTWNWLRADAPDAEPFSLWLRAIAD